MKEAQKEQPKMYKGKSEREANRIENLKMRKESTESNVKKCQLSYDLKSVC